MLEQVGHDIINEVLKKRIEEHAEQIAADLVVEFKERLRKQLAHLVLATMRHYDVEMQGQRLIITVNHKAE